MTGGEVTRLLRQMNGQRGEARRQTYDELIALVHHELHRRARVQLRGERADSLRPTAIVSEIYERMREYNLPYNDSAHFLNVAATAMRRHLIDRARRVKAAKRGAGHAATTLRDGTAVSLLGVDPVLLLDVERAMAELSEDEQQLVEQRFFVGFTNEEIAKLRGLSVDTVKHRWKVAKAKLLKTLKEWERGAPAPAR